MAEVTVSPLTVALLLRMLPRRRLLRTRNTCNGCHMKLTQGAVAAAKIGAKLAHCDNCGRIIYWALN
jgi:transcription elongation factor Elf1